MHCRMCLKHPVSQLISVHPNALSYFQLTHCKSLACLAYRIIVTHRARGHVMRWSLLFLEDIDGDSATISWQGFL